MQIIKRVIRILQHKIKYWYSNDQEMPEHEQEYVASMIAKGFNQGELNCLMPDETENRGWWKIL